jgi:hypothetical protein
MDTSASGTALSSSIVSAGTVGDTTFSSISTTGAFTVGANQGLCSNLGPISVNGGSTLAAHSQNYNNIAINDADGSSSTVLNLSGAAASATVASATACIYLGPPSSSGGSGEWGRFGLGAASEYAMLEISQGSGCTTEAPPSGYVCARLEGSSSTAHSGYFFLQPQHAYWFSYWWNNSGSTVAGQAPGTMLLHVYTVDGTPIPCMTSSGCATLGGNGQIAADIISNQTATLTAGSSGSSLSSISIGNNQSTTNSGTTSYYQNVMFNSTTAPFPLFWAQTDPWARILAPARGSSWSTAGVVGGVPHITSPVCATLTSSATSEQINSAISSCSSSGGGVVSLGAGTYSGATGGISFGAAHNVTLRGAGANQTLFNPTSEWTIDNPSSTYEGNATNLTSWTPGGGVGGANPFTLKNQYPEGISTIILASGNNLAVGNDIILDQVDPTVDYGGLLVAQLDSGGTAVSPGVAGPWTSEGNDVNVARGTCHGSSPCYSQQQTVTVTGCNGVTTVGSSCSGSNVTVTISPGLQMPNWGYDYAGNSLSTSAWWPASEPQGDGIEDLGLNMANCSGCAAIDFLVAQNSWVNGVAVTNGSPSDLGLIRVEVGHHITIENSYVFGGIVGSTGVYGIELDGCSDCLVVNNIVQGVSTPLIQNSSSVNNVWAYNYANNGFYTLSLLYNIPARGDHGSGIAKNLTEGNVTNGHTQDSIHGTANLETDFRNNFWGTYPSCADSSSYTGSYGQCSQNMTPLNDSVFHRFANFVGNVLGSSGVETTYSTTNFVTGGGPYAIYQYGGQTVNSADPNVQQTAVIWGNADAVTGFGSPRFNCSEVGEGTAYDAQPVFYQASLYNPCPISNSLPASFFYTSTPSWWPSGKPWPLIGPDVTGGNLLQCSGGSYPLAVVTSSSQCTGGTSSSYAGGHANSNPAMDCFFSLGGVPNGTGGPLSFNRASCYAESSTGPSGAAPAPPTGLTAVVSST